MFDRVFRIARVTGFAVIAGMALAGMAPAATLGTFTHNYGSAPGRIDPGGNDLLSRSFVTVNDRSTGRFFDSFDFSSLSYSSITSIALSLQFTRAGPSGSILVPTELWAVRIQGSSSGAFLDDQFAFLSDAGSPQTTTISAATDILLVNAFANSLATVAFRLGEGAGASTAPGAGDSDPVDLGLGDRLGDLVLGAHFLDEGATLHALAAGAHDGEE